MFKPEERSFVKEEIKQEIKREPKQEIKTEVKSESDDSITMTKSEFVKKK